MHSALDKGDKKSDILVTCFVIGIFLVLASSAIYYAENAAQPEKFGSIPHSLWYTIVTMSTVGFVDLNPVTPLGKVIAILVAVLGIVFFALLAGIITSGYMEATEACRVRERSTFLGTSETNIDENEPLDEHYDGPHRDMNP